MMEGKLKYASMWPLRYHSGITLANRSKEFPLSRVDKAAPLPKNTKVGKPSIQALQYFTLYDRRIAQILKGITNSYHFHNSRK